MSKKRRLGTGKKKKHKMKRFRGRDRHHLVNKVNGGTNAPSNLLLIDIDRHHAWHELFRNLSLEEVIILLQRTKSLKDRQDH